MPEHKINYNNYPYQVINGKIYDLSIPCRQLNHEEFLITKPLVPLLTYLAGRGAIIKDSFEWCIAAAIKGDLEALQWLRANGAPWDTYTCSFAAYYGHLKVLCWARENGAPWDEWVCSYATQKKNLKILCWAYVNGCPCYDIDAQKAQQVLLREKYINWSLHCIKIRTGNHCEPLRHMAEKVVNECNDTTYVLLPTCLTKLIINYL